MSNVVTLDHEPERPSGALTPLDMLNTALSRGADITVMEKLMALHERWEAAQARKAFDDAIASAKAEIGPVMKNKEGHNKTRYASFDAIARAVDPILSRHGLSYRFRTAQTDRIHVTCILSHRGGHSEETTLAGPADTTGSKNAIQAIGSTLTYLQRYSLVQAIGLAVTTDDDGKAAGGLAGGVITDAQADTIRDLATEVGADVPRFLRYLDAESIADIPAKDYQRAVSALEAKRRPA
jgi:hypothetical protein